MWARRSRNALMRAGTRVKVALPGRQRSKLGKGARPILACIQGSANLYTLAVQDLRLHAEDERYTQRSAKASNGSQWQNVLATFNHGCQGFMVA